jgi:serine/threonine-protein kinase
VAIKTCEVASLEVRARFEREARLSARLRHPLITTVYDFGVEAGGPFLVCEFLEGADLDEIFSRNPDLPLLEKLDILIAVAEALECAHGAGVLHRDVKPGNVRILPDGSVKLMDFGIAKSLLGDEKLTCAGITVGSSAYMSPEQARGEPLDARTDLFSLGVLSYELLAGRKPFRDPDLLRLLEKIVTEEPDPLRSIAADLPSSLAALVHRCLAKDRDARPASAEEIRLAFRAIRAEVLAAAGLSPPPPPSGEDLALESAPKPRIGPGAGTLRRLRRRFPRLAAALLLLAAAGLMLYSLRRDGVSALRFPELRRAPVVRWAPPPPRLSP